MHLHVAGLDIPDTHSVNCRNTNVTLTRSVYWGWGGGGTVRTREDLSKD